MEPVPNLPTLVRDKFKAAQENGDLTFYQTQVSVLRCHGTPFQVRYSPALANKPKSNKPRNPAANEKPFDPFADPPAGLLIVGLSAHVLVLNKFPVTPDHFILATREFKEQTQVLEEDDLAAAYACIKAYREAGEELFGFYNSGEHSGASQPHRHVQFLPVESMRSGMGGGEGWEVLADTPPSDTDLPFARFWSNIPENPSSQELLTIYTTLHREAVQSMRKSSVIYNAGDTSPISYNLGITHKAMVLCPRTSEGRTFESSKSELIGPVALNGTLLAGTLLVKSEIEWDTLREDQSKLIEILSSIGTSSIKNDTRI